MRRFRDAVCLIVAVASIAIAAWQPAFTADAAPATAGPNGVQQVDDRLTDPVDRAVSNALLLRA